MEEITKKEIAEEQTTSTEEEITTTEQETDPLKEAVEEQLKKIQRQNLLLGAQTVCHVIRDKIIATESKPGKTTMADYRRLVKDILNFCTTGLLRKVNADGETEPVVEESSEEQTVQN
jgi:hypothetical protein